MTKSERRTASRLGQAVRRARSARGWSQAKLAEEVDVSTDYIGLLERGERLPSFTVVVQLADRFGVTLGSLLAEGPEPWVDEAMALLRAVPAEAREVVLRMLRGVASGPRKR